MKKICRKEHLIRSGKWLIALLLCVCMIGTMIPITAKAGESSTGTVEQGNITALTTASGIPYMKWNASKKQLESATCSSATEVTSDDTEWGSEGQTKWYVVNQNITIGSAETPKTITVKGNVHLILVMGCKLTVKGRIQVNDGTGTLTIHGQRLSDEETSCQLSVEASGSEDAIIGSSSGKNTTITIDSGYLTVNAPPDRNPAVGAIIGSGKNGTANITINGGRMEVYDHDGNVKKSTGAIIGSGEGGTANITINGGIVGSGKYSSIRFGYDGANIGSGKDGTANITINGGTIYSDQGNYGAAIGGGRYAPGHVIINGGTIQCANAFFGAGIGGGFGCSTTSTVEINGGTVNWAKSRTGAGIGTGRESAGGGTVNITGGTIGAYSSNGAGIGSGMIAPGAVNITISGGTVTAESTYESIQTDQDNGAAIGGGYNSPSGTILISSGKVNAKGGKAGPGIGSGKAKNMGNITISGGEVNARGGLWAPGIGNAEGSTASGTIEITNGKVEATGGDYAAGIGSGYHTKPGKIVIGGGEITALGGTLGAGIGTGNGVGEMQPNYPVDIEINDGTVTATGGKNAAGIGTGRYVRGSGTININGGTVIANRGEQVDVFAYASDIGNGADLNSSSDIAFNLGGSNTNSGSAWVAVGNAVTNLTATSGVLFIGKSGTVYGSYAPTSNHCIAGDESLYFSAGASMNTGNYKLYVDGTLPATDRVTGNVYYPLTLNSCTATGATSNYEDKLYGKANASIILTPSVITDKKFKSWTVNPSVNISSNKFTMPYSSLSVTANYVQVATIETQPQTQEVTYGNDVELSVSAKNPSGNTVGLTYQWYKGTQVLQDQTQSTLTLDNPDAGTYQYYCKVFYNGEDINSETVTVTVNKASLIVTANDNTIIYGEVPSDNGVSYNGFVNDENESVLTGNITYTYSYSQYDDVGDNYTITPSGLTSGNYAISYNNGKLTVQQKEIGIVWSNTSLTYTGEAQAPIATATGLVNEDSCLITVTGAQTNAGSYTATASMLSNNNYKLPADSTTTLGNAVISVEFTINKATPYIETAPTAAEITYGDTLGDSAISGGTVQHSDINTTTVVGSFAWGDSSINPSVSDSNNTTYAIVFTPSDTVNYNTVETEITLTVNKAANTPNMPSATMNVAYDCEKVSDVTLPTDWIWQDADKNKELVVGSPVTATAVYNGSDKGNYVNETVSVTITRSACEHNYIGKVTTEPTTEKEGVRTYTCDRCGHSYTESIPKLPVENHEHSYSGSVTKEPTCTDTGVRTYICSCGDRYTETTPALGHNYIGKVTTEPTTDREGVRTYTCDRCGHSYTESIPKLPDNKKPFIKDETGKEGWDVIKDEVDKTKDGDTVVVEMNGSSVVPGNVIDKIKGKDVTIVFDMGGGITWSVNGNSITGDKIGDIDFSVTVDTNTIPVDVINNVTGERYSKQISLAYDGEFGFTAVLSINMEKKNAGLYANLFYYNEKTGKLEFICADKIAEDGTAELTFTHASDYSIVIDKTPMDGSGNSDNKDDAPDTGDRTPVVWLFVLVVISVTGMILAVKKGRINLKELRK